MKTIVRSINRVSLYLYTDDTPLFPYMDRIVVGEPTQLTIGDCNESNCIIYLSVTPPFDWAGEKYIFDGVSWTLNPDYINPEA